MSLMRFLTATHSIKGDHEKPIPYRLSQENLLPKFGSPARGRTRAQEDLNGSKQRPEPKPGLSPVDLSATAQTKPKAMEAQKTGTWKFWRNWFAPKPRPAATPVQAEFPLDGVRVVRNDLADADLEVAAKKSKQAATEMAVTLDSKV